MRGKTRKKTLRENIWVVPIALVILVIFMIGVIKMYGKNKKTQQAREELAAELLELETKYNNLEVKLDKLSTERGVEEELRDQYHVVVEGEEQIVIIENEPENIDNKEKSWLADLFH
jgi:cell division protein FtsB